MVKTDFNTLGKTEDKQGSFVRTVKPKTNTIIRGKGDKAKYAPKVMVAVKDPNLSASQNRKKFSDEKKMRRKSSFDTIKTVNKLYSDLLIASRDAPKGNFKKVGRCTPETIRICSEIIKITRDNFLSYADHRSISRAIQAIVSYGDEKQREYVMNALVPNFIKLSQLIHGSRLCCKLLACSDRKDLARYLDSMTKDFKTANEMFFHRFGAQVWDKLGDLDIRASQLRKMLYKVFLPKSIWYNKPNLVDLPYSQLHEALNDEEKAELQAYLGKLLDRLFDKVLYTSSSSHILMLYYMMFGNEGHAADLLSKLEDSDNGHSALLSTREGAEVLCKLLGYASAKQKKKFAKAIKDAALDVVCNKHVNVVFLRLLNTMDDTKQLKDSTISEMIKPTVLSQIVCDKVGSRSILAVLNPASLKRYITVQDRELLDLPAPSSKKDAGKRRDEIIEPLLTALNSLFMCEQQDKIDEEQVADMEIEEGMDEEDEFFTSKMEDADEMNVEEDGSTSSSSSSSSSDDEDDDEDVPEDEQDRDDDVTSQHNKLASVAPSPQDVLPSCILDFAAHEIASNVLVEYLSATSFPSDILMSLFNEFAAGVSAKIAAVTECLVVKTTLTRIFQEIFKLGDDSKSAEILGLLNNALNEQSISLVNVATASPKLSFFVAEIFKQLSMSSCTLKDDLVKAFSSKQSVLALKNAKNEHAENKDIKGFELLETALLLCKGKTESLAVSEGKGAKKAKK